MMTEEHTKYTKCTPNSPKSSFFGAFMYAFVHYDNVEVSALQQT